MVLLPTEEVLRQTFRRRLDIEYTIGSRPHSTVSDSPTCLLHRTPFPATRFDFPRSSPYSHGSRPVGRTEHERVVVKGWREALYEGWCLRSFTYSENETIVTDLNGYRLGRPPTPTPSPETTSVVSATRRRKDARSQRPNSNSSRLNPPTLGTLFSL